MSKVSSWIVYLLVLTLALAACTPVQPAAPTTSDTTTTESAAEATEAPAEEAELSTGGSLVIYSGRSENLVGPLIEQFEEATGIDVEVRYGSTPEIAATLLEEGANSPADVFFAQDPGGLGAVTNEGLLAELPADILNAVKPEFSSPDGLWVGVAGRARVIVYNTDLLSEEDLPDDIDDLADPVWAGRFGLAPTNASFQAMVTAVRVMWGEDEAREWLEGIAANDPVIFEGNSAIVEAVGAGEIEVGLVNHYYLYRFLAEQGEEFPARNYFLPSGGPGSLVMVAGAGRLATGANEENALSFIEYLVSPEAQQYFTEQTNEYPVIDGVAGPEGLTPIEELNSADIALEDLADLAGTQQLLAEVGLLQ
jgi:iron(III) transport system substrate-binding protein